MLERPLAEVHRSGSPDFPFCVCWANENWTRRWDGHDDDILVAQQYSFEPQCIVVPEETPVTFRATSTDVVHGFVVGTTNFNGSGQFRFALALPLDDYGPRFSGCRPVPFRLRFEIGIGSRQLLLPGLESPSVA